MDFDKQERTSPEVPRELREKLKAQAESMLPGASIGGLAGAGIQAGQANTMYSPRLALLAQIDEALDEHVRKMADLREFRRTVNYQPDYVCELINRAIQLRG
jgi:hypothetical protein